MEQFLNQNEEDEDDLNYNKRELDDNDALDDLDAQADMSNQSDEEDIQKKEQFQNHLLFNIQGLGGIGLKNGDNIYLKGKFCEDSLKDLCRSCKKDHPDKMQTRVEMGKWNVLQTDLLELLLTQSQDKVLSYYLIVLLIQLTELPSKENKNKHILMEYLKNYKQAFLRKTFIRTLMEHLHSCIEVEIKTRAHSQMIEAIIILIKNILAIPDQVENSSVSDEIKKNLHNLTIQNFIKESAMDALLYLVQDFEVDYMKKHALLFLEIFYHLLSCFDPEDLIYVKTNEEKLDSMFQEQQQKKIIEQKKLNGRHSNFGALFQYKRQVDGTFRIVDNTKQQKQNIINTCVGQRHKPQRRKEYKKQFSIFRKPITEDCMIEMEENYELVQFSYLQKMMLIVIEFIQNGFNSLMKNCYDDIIKADPDKIEEYDKVNYMVVLSFAIKFRRLLYQKEKQLSPQEKIILDLHDIKEAIEITQFECVYGIAVAETTLKSKKQKFNMSIFFAACNYLKELFFCIKDMQHDMHDENNKKNAQILLSNIFRHDITKLMKIGFDNCLEGYLKDSVAICLIEMQHVFFDLLEQHSQGKVMTMQTGKVLKKKKKAKGANKKNKKERENDDLDGFIEKDTGEQDYNNDEDFDVEKEKKKQSADKNKRGEEENNKNESSGEEEEGQNEGQNAEDDEDDEIKYQERSFTLRTEFSVLVCYEVISKVLYLIDDDKILYNGQSLNTSVFKYIDRILKWLRADWILYQFDYLSIFQKILSNPEINKRIEYKTSIIKTLNQIVKNYFLLLEKNHMLIIESLFRFSDKQTKEDILNNYENQNENAQQNADPNQENQEVGQFNNDENDDNYLNSKTKWNKVEDKAIIDNYENFSSLENWEDHLINLLKNMGFQNKTHKDLSLSEACREVKSVIKSYDLEIADVLNFINQQCDYYLEKLKKFAKDEQQTLQILTNQDFAIVPVEEQEFDILEIKQIQRLLESIDFRLPSQGEIYWRIPGYFRAIDIEILKEQIQITFESISNEIVLSQDQDKQISTQIQIQENLSEIASQYSQEVQQEDLSQEITYKKSKKKVLVKNTNSDLKQNQFNNSQQSLNPELSQSQQIQHDGNQDGKESEKENVQDYSNYVKDTTNNNNNKIINENKTNEEEKKLQSQYLQDLEEIENIFSQKM